MPSSRPLTQAQVTALTVGRAEQDLTNLRDAIIAYAESMAGTPSTIIDGEIPELSELYLKRLALLSTLQMAHEIYKQGGEDCCEILGKLRDCFEGEVEWKLDRSQAEYVDLLKKLFEIDRRYVPDEEQRLFKDSGDDDLEIADEKIDLSCPITKTLLKDPVKNITCGHTYSRDAIDDLLRLGNSNQVSCPVSGCVQKVRSGALVKNGCLEWRVLNKKMEGALDTLTGTLPGVTGTLNHQRPVPRRL